MKPSLPIALIAALALVFAACGGSDDDPDTAATPPAPGQTAPADPAPVERPIIGIGEQGAKMFASKRFTELGIKYVRLVASYDTTSVDFERAVTDQWLAAARAAGAEPFITFGHSRVKPKKLPSVTEFRTAFRAFQKRYPDVKVYAPWNEINHVSQPTSDAPKRAAEYYNVVRAECGDCTVLAGDVLDQAGMTRYVKEYQRHLEGEPENWGLHNYADTNRFRSSGLRDLLDTVKGGIWLTETGGLVQFGRNFPRDEQRAARATTYALKQARDNERVKRIYLYNWTGADAKARFDAGLIAPDGNPRPAYNVLRDALKK